MAAKKRPIWEGPPLVRVVWDDAHGSAADAYAPKDLPHKAMRMTLYGLLLRDDDIGVSLAAEDCNDGTYRGHAFVPRAMVVSLEVLLAAPVRKGRTVVSSAHEESNPSAEP